MAEHIINFVEGEGIAIQSSLDVAQEAWNVEIANTIGGLLDAKGDLVTASDLDTAARLPVGTDGQVLTADSSTDTGLRWAAAAADGGDPALDTLVWMPLTTVVGGTPELVWDADDDLIPTLTPLLT